MIKKIYSLSAMALMIGAAAMSTSCSSDEFVMDGNGDEVAVTFTAKLPAGLQSRVENPYGDGTTATNLTYVVYTTDGTQVEHGTATFNSLTATVNLRLVNGESYKVAFWAQSEMSVYTFNAADATVTANYASAKANDEALDAFYAYVPLTVNGNMTPTVELYRPFAQINVLTSDLAVAAQSGINPTTSSFAVNIPTKFSLADGSVDNYADVTFAANAKPAHGTDKITVAGQEIYDMLAMNYVFAPASKTVLGSVSMTLNIANDATKTYANIPVQRNYRTNIYGNLLTSTVDYLVEIKPGFETPDHNVNSTWDGTTLTIVTPVTKTIDGYEVEVYNVSTGAELAYMAQAANLKDAYIELTNDIDLNGNSWIPFGAVGRKDDSNMFTGTLDGAGFTISNFTASANGDEQCAALIASANGATIKNVKIAGANVKASDTAAGLVAFIKGTTVIENCEAIVNIESIYENPGSSIIGTAIGGLVGRVYGQNCLIKDCKCGGTITVNSGVNAQSKVGGIVGLLGINLVNGLTISNCTSNVEIKGTSDFGMGGIVGGALHNTNVMITGCVNNGNITNDYHPVSSLSGAGGIVGCAQSINYNGANDNFVITHCTNNGVIKGYHTTGVGQIVGALVNATFDTSTCTENGEAIVLN